MSAFTANKERDRRLEKEIHERLEAEFNELDHVDRYVRFLGAMSRFSRYSCGNIMRIFMQKPDATMIGSHGEWKGKNRKLKDKETSFYVYIAVAKPKRITINAEVTDPETGAIVYDHKGDSIIEKQTVFVDDMSYFLEQVYDISQTEGEPVLATEIPGKTEEHKKIFAKALESTIESPTITWETIEPECGATGQGLLSNMIFGGDADCIYYPGEKVTLREGMEEKEKVLALLKAIALTSASGDNIVAASVYHVLAMSYDQQPDYETEAVFAEVKGYGKEEMLAKLNKIRWVVNTVKTKIEKTYTDACSFSLIEYEETVPEPKPLPTIVFTESSYAITGSEHKLYNAELQEKAHENEDAPVTVLSRHTLSDHKICTMSDQQN